MSEIIPTTENNPEKIPVVTLRTATENDARFLFDVKIEAMSKVHEDLHPNQLIDIEEEFMKYMDGFDAEKISVIEFKGKDVGRLRVVRSDDLIYVGGLQILPEYQKMGIGSVIFKELMDESDRTGKPIITDIHHVNIININWKKKLGFKEVASNDKQVTMRYN